MLLAVALPLLGGVALFEHYALTRQRLQLRVDEAAAHAADALASGEGAETEAQERLAKAGLLRQGGRVEVETPPRSGRFRGWSNAVRVRVRQPWSPPLLPRAFSEKLPLDVAATAVAVPPGPGHSQPVFLRVE